MSIQYDPLADEYVANIGGVEMCSKDALALDDILHRLDDRETRREDTRATCVAILLATGLIALTAIVAALMGG
jgi:fatty acid desaturase